MTNHPTDPPPLPATDAPEDHGLPALTPDVVEQDQNARIDNVVPTDGFSKLPVVGLGGSAGGLAALKSFFGAMPPDSGMAFVVIMHLSPEHESILAEVLQHSTRMLVRQVRDRVRVEANQVYVIPPGKHLSMSDGHLHLSEPARARPGKHVAVDLFFRTLADANGPHSAAIVLSGADSDGAIGIKRIKERGGLTVAQDPTEAEHDSMPRSTIATGMVDWVLPASEMPKRLCEYWRTGQRLRLPSEDGPQPAREPASTAESKPLGADDMALHDVLGFLRTRTGRDFSYYKRATILRRIARRMQVNGVEEISRYLNFLRTHPGETGALLQDLLISVTNFFRDREAFAALEAVIPTLFQGKGPGDTIRIWSAACASGEEAYSLAMMFSEYAGQFDQPPSIQIFATDLDENAIQQAREGTYPETISADVSEERLRRFFTKGHGNYRVKREVRESVLFALHDLLKDSPFSRLDLVACRNLLIYLNRDAQERALDIFHFALRPERMLFLGSSESVDEQSALFAVTDKRHRLYSRRVLTRPKLPTMFSGPSAQTLAMLRNQGAFFLHRTDATLPPVEAPPTINLPDDKQPSWAEVHARAVEQFGAPSVIVNEQHDMVHLSGQAGRLLAFSDGEVTTNLLRVVHPMLRVELRAALFRAEQSGTVAETFGVPVETGGVRRVVDLRVAPEVSGAPDCRLIIFTEREPAASEAADSAAGDDEPAVRELERELEQSKTRLRDSVEQSDASQEELKASNEELQAMNEELRSTSEELETGREELQSINEELTTVNLEMKSKVEELADANGDLQNLMASTQIATLFLDRSLCIGRYTPPAVALFNLIPTDVGRPISDLTTRLNYPDLAFDAERVLTNLTVVELEVPHTDGRYFMARLRPYRTADDRISGVVLTFVDISARKQAEDALRASEARLKLVVESARDFAIFTLDEKARVTSWNRGAQELFGHHAAGIVGQSADVLRPPDEAEAGRLEDEMATARREGRAVSERWHRRADGTLFWGSGSVVPLDLHAASGAGEPGFLVILSDRTEARQAEQALEENRAQLLESLRQNEQARAAVEAASQAKDHFLAVLSHELRTPLTPVMMAVHLLARDPQMPASARMALETIQRNVEIEAHFIDDLLDLTRIEHGKLEITREPMDLHDTVRRAVDICAGDVQAKNQRLSLALKATDHQVTGDSTRLQQVFWNLLKNAAKFTPEGGSIRVASRNAPGRVIVEVTDSGMGFDAAVATRIFNAFTQASQEVTREFGGLGLGLAISKATVEAHGGTLAARSPGRGQGAVFTVELPRSA